MWPCELSQQVKEENLPPAVADSRAIDGYIAIEACKSWQVFKRQANQIFTDLCGLIPDKHLALLFNENGAPRRGAFEISVLRDIAKMDEAVLVWTGIKRGPPRREKFPDPSKLIDDILKALK